MVCANLDPPALSRVARSCSALQDAATREIWRAPEVWGREAGRAFAEACLSRPELASLVASLNCDEDAGLGIFVGSDLSFRRISFPRCGSLGLRQSQSSTLRRVLSNQSLLFPNLRALTLSEPTYTPFDIPMDGTPTISTLTIIDVQLSARETVALYKYPHFGSVESITVEFDGVYPCEISALSVFSNSVRHAAIYTHGRGRCFWEQRQEEGIVGDVGLSDILPRLESLDLAPGPILEAGLVSKPFTALKTFHLRVPIRTYNWEGEAVYEEAIEALKSITQVLRSGLFPKLKTFRLSIDRLWKTEPPSELVDLREYLRRTGILMEEDGLLRPWALL